MCNLYRLKGKGQMRVFPDLYHVKDEEKLYRRCPTDLIDLMQYNKQISNKILLPVFINELFVPIQTPRPYSLFLIHSFT